MGVQLLKPQMCGTWIKRYWVCSEFPYISSAVTAWVFDLWGRRNVLHPTHHLQQLVWGKEARTMD